MKRYIASASSKEKYLSANPDLIVQTPREGYKSDGAAEYYDSIDDWCLDMFDIPSKDIRYLIGLYDGDNEDTGIETKDGRYFIAYSGHGTEEVSESQLLDYFSYDV